MVTHKSTAPSPESQTRVLFIPEGFDPREDLPHGVRKQRDPIVVLMDRLTVQGILGGQDGWVGLSAEGLERLFRGRKTRDKVLGVMSDRGILERDPAYRYRDDPHTRHFRATDQWRSRLPVATDMGDPHCVEWIGREDSRRIDREQWSPVHYGLDRWLRRITMDMDVARPILEAMPANKRHLAELTAGLVRSGARTPTLDPFGHRFHSVVSSMPKLLRPALRYEGKEFGEIDVANCQPLLIALLILNFPVHPSIVNHDYWRGERDGGGTGEVSYSLRRILSITSFDKACNHAPKDLLDYMEVCCSGTYYETLAEVLGMACGTPDERDAVKLQSCYIFFDKTRPRSESWKRFRRRWPSVAERLLLLKRGNHKNAAMELQRAESDAMLHGVAWSIMGDHPSVPVLTIHDAILVPQDALCVAREAIGDIWSKFGRKPHLK